MNENNKNKITATCDYISCIYDNCIRIPEIIYSYNPLKSDIIYRCDFHNNGGIKQINLSEFLEKSSNINCYECKSNITKEDIYYYCKQCKNVFDLSCSKRHKDISEHSIISIPKDKFFNNCLNHNYAFTHYCLECNKSLCYSCNLIFHKNSGHNLVEIKNVLNNQNNKEKLNTTFQKQKILLEKIKEINKNIFESLEKDILIKKRIIENGENNINNLQSISNYNRLEIKNNYKYEKLLDSISNKEDKIKSSENSGIDRETFINRILSPLYYSMMINTNENFNKLLIDSLEKIIKLLKENNEININEYKDINYKNDIHYIFDSKDNKLINLEKNNKFKTNNISFDSLSKNSNIINNNKNLELNHNNEIKNNQKNNENFNISDNIILVNYIKEQLKIENNKDIKENIDKKNLNTLKEENNKFFDSMNSNINNNKYGDNINKDIVNQNNDILLQNGKNNLSNQDSKQITNNKDDIIDENKTNLNFNNFNPNIINNNLYDPIFDELNNNINDKNNNFNISSNNDNSKRNLNILNNNNIINDDVQVSNSTKKNLSSNSYEEKSINDKSNKSNINNCIYNMIILYTGNFEIYDFRKLNFSGNNNIKYNNNQIKENSLLQRINLVKCKRINYVFEFPDKTLLCATYSKIFRLKLTNNDSSHNILGIIKLENYELPTQLISLGDSLLVVLSEQKKYCNIRVFIKKEENKINNITDIPDYNFNKNSETSGINNNELLDFSSNDISDVPPVGNNLFYKKDLKIDKSFKSYVNKLNFKNNIKIDKKLVLSVYEIKKKIKDEYLHEFITTSNKVYDYGENRIEFYGAKEIGEGNLYFSRIKIIENISCSVEVNAVSQIKDKYLCVGLQNHNLKGQISGYAFIDIYNREICRIIRDEEVSCVYFDKENDLLLASMEVRAIKNYFMKKIYKIIKNNNDKGQSEIDLKMIYEYKNEHNDTVSSIIELKPLCFSYNIEKEKITENIIFSTSSHDSTLEVIKTNIKY